MKGSGSTLHVAVFVPHTNCSAVDGVSPEPVNVIGVPVTPALGLVTSFWKLADAVKVVAVTPLNGRDVPGRPIGAVNCVGLAGGAVAAPLAVAIKVTGTSTAAASRTAIEPPDLVCRNVFMVFSLPPVLGFSSELCSVRCCHESRVNNHFWFIHSGLRGRLVMRMRYFKVTGAASNVSTDMVWLGLNVPVAPATALDTTTVLVVRNARVTSLPLTRTRL